MWCQRSIWPVVIILSSLGAGFMVFSNVMAVIRPIVVLWFLFICPGMAFVRLLRLNEGITQLTLAIALSLALDAIVAGTMLYAGIWSPKGTLGIVIMLSLLGAALQIDTMRGGAAVQMEG